MSASNYLENKVLDHLWGGTTFTAPATGYVSLHTADPTETGATGELSGNGYARVAVVNNTTNWPNASSGSKSNGVDISFPTPTGSGYPTVSHFAIWDAPTGGNCLQIGALGTPKACPAGDPVKFPAGSLVLTAD